jgi:hypothetical protein
MIDKLVMAVIALLATSPLWVLALMQLRLERTR